MRYLIMASPPFVKGGWGGGVVGGTGFLNSKKWGKSQGGGEKEGERGVFEIFIGGGGIAGDETSNRKKNFRII